MSRVGFNFGEDNSYLYDGPISWERSNVLRAIEDTFHGLYTVIDIYCVAFGPQGAYYMSFVRNDGNMKYVDDCVYGNLPESLLQFLGPTTKEVYSPLLGTTVSRAGTTRSIATTRVWLGPNHSYYVEDATLYQSGSLPPDLLSFIESSTRKDNLLLYLTLGYGGSYFVAFQDGQFFYNLVPCSKELDEALDMTIYYPGDPDRKNHPVKVTDIEYLSVSAFEPNRWILFYKDGTYYCSFPESWHIRCEPISSTTASYLKRIYPTAKMIPASVRKIMVAKLSAFQLDTTVAVDVAALSLSPDQTASSSVIVGASSAPDSTFHTNTTDAGAVDLSSGDNMVTGTALGDVPSIFHSASIGIDLTDASNMDTVSFAMTGHSYGWHGEGGAASGGGSYGGDGGGV